MRTAPANPLRPIFLVYSVIFFTFGAALALLRPADAQARFFGASMIMRGVSPTTIAGCTNPAAVAASGGSSPGSASGPCRGWPWSARSAPQEMIATLLHATYHLPGESAEIRAVDEVLQRCLAKEPRHRYASASDVAMDLCPALAACAGVAAMAANSQPPSPSVEDLTR